MALITKTAAAIVQKAAASKKGRTVKIIILRETFIGGKYVEPSDKPIDAPESDAKELIVMGKAKAAPEKKKAAPKKTAEPKTKAPAASKKAKKPAKK